MRSITHIYIYVYIHTHIYYSIFNEILRVYVSLSLQNTHPLPYYIHSYNGDKQTSS